jgi:hypothetical protein
MCVLQGGKAMTESAREAARAEFEAFILDQYSLLETWTNILAKDSPLSPTSNYSNEFVRFAWLAWQAAIDRHPEFTVGAAGSDLLGEDVGIGEADRKGNRTAQAGEGLKKMKCRKCGKQLMCPSCAGQRGGTKTAKIYPGQAKNWGKLGGRPSKKSGKIDKEGVKP